MRTFEDLFKLVAAHDGEITLSFETNRSEESARRGLLKVCRIRASLPREQVVGREFVVSPTDARMQRDRGGMEVMHLREAVHDVYGALHDQINSPAKMLSRLAGREE